MKCRYEYKGKTFKSEADLDEFLLINDALKGSDSVFSRWSKQQDSVYRKIKSANDAAFDAEKKGDIVTVENQGEPEDTDNIRGKGNYKSITELIHQIRIKDSEGEEHPLFPIYDSDNYWSKQWEKYRNGEFDSKVMAQVPFIEDLLTKVGDQYQPVKDQNTLNKIRKRMEDVWVQQALCGDVVHAMLSDFYKAKTDKNKRFSSLSDAELKTAFEEITQNEYYSKFKDYINDNVINTIITEARKLDAEIRAKYGEDCMILSEKRLVGQGIIDGNAVPIVGKMDLFVISPSGKMAILDFKCSPKEYTEYNQAEDPNKYDPAKVLTFKYQLAAYRRLLASIGISDSEANIDLGVIPLQFQNYRLNYDTKKVEFDGVKSMDSSIQILSNTSASTGGNLYTTIESNLEQIFPTENNIDNLTTGNILDDIQNEEKILFKEMKKRKNMTDEDIANFIKNKGGIKKNKITNNWEFRPYKLNDKEVFKANGKKSQEEAEVIIFNKVKEKFKRRDGYVSTTTESIRKDFKEAFKDGKSIDFRKLAKKISYSKEDPQYTQKQLERYNNPLKYTLLSAEDLDPILNQLGILMFKNKFSGLIDIIKISDQFDPTMTANLGGENVKNKNTLFGTFLTDELVNSDSNSQAMSGVVGNVELMEVMLLLNKLPNLFNNNSINGVGRIELINPGTQRGLTASNEQLLYNFRRLCKLGNIKNNFVNEHNQEGIIKMADFISLCRATFDEILSSPDTESGLGKLRYIMESDIKSCISDLDNLGENPVILKQKLMQLDDILTSEYEHLKVETRASQNEQTNPEYKLHQDILYAISQLSGVKLLQQIEDHSKFGISWKGVSGTMSDNPGTLQSKTLNEFTDQVTKAYQNVRDNVIAFNQELRQKVEALKKAKGFGLGKQYGFGNQVQDLYYNMYDQESDDLMFVNPWDNNNSLTIEERDFLKFAILKINDNRIKNFNPANIEALIKSDPSKYLKVPLVKGDMASEVAVRGGILNFIRSKFAMLSPSNIKERLDRAATNLFSDNQLKQIENGDMWHAINHFDASEDSEFREKLLSSYSLGGKGYFEHNLETLLLKHTSAYRMADELNDIFPTLKALTMHLNAQGAILNEKFQNDLEYIFKYVKSRIHNQPLEQRTNGLDVLTAEGIKKLMSTTSKLALAFNPRQWYQFIDGFWKDILMYYKTNSDQDTPFTKEGMMFAVKKVYQDLFHFGNQFTVTELLNQQYGFNDMDANTYIDRIKTDNTGILYHFWNVGFRFASRPDYYNRMTLFYAQMHKDGCIDAHKIVDGKLVYDWTKDKRFDAFAKGDKSNIEKYNKQKSLFITMARQLELEGAKNADGTLYQMDLNKPNLPKAYTNRDSESMKALSDRIYGYYAHEKKAMIHSTLIGSLFMQMNTFWSAKKNQYAQERSFTQEGKWVQYEEDGQKYYWKEDSDGDLIPTTENTGVPVQVWKGKPQEGIGLTVIEIGKAFIGKSDLTDKSRIQGVYDLFNNENIDPELRKLYSANMRQLLSDLILYLIIGQIMFGALANQASEYAKASGNASLGNSLANTALQGGVGILQASTQDANAFESIFGRGKDWTPFAIKKGDKLIKDLTRVVTGNLDLYDFLIKNNGATNSTKPFWDSVKINTLGYKIGQQAPEE